MTDRSQYDEALYRLEASDWQRQEGNGDPMQEVAVAHVHASLAIVDELRRLNSDRSQWYREVLEVLTAAKDVEGSLRSEQPAAAPGCLICGNRASKFSCPKGATLTQEQWTAHRDEEINESVRHGADWTDAQRYADRETTERFGPCPEES